MKFNECYRSCKSKQGQKISNEKHLIYLQSWIKYWSVFEQQRSQGVLYEGLHREASPQGPTPNPFVYHFDRKCTPFVYV